MFEFEIWEVSLISILSYINSLVLFFLMRLKHISKICILNQFHISRCKLLACANVTFEKMIRASNRTLKTTTSTKNSKTDAKMVQNKKNKILKKNRRQKKRREGRMVSKKVLYRFRDRKVLKVLECIERLHRRVALERGVDALRRVQNEARKIAWERLMVMKLCGVSWDFFCYCG